MDSHVSFDCNGACLPLGLSGSPGGSEEIYAHAAGKRIKAKAPVTADLQPDWAALFLWFTQEGKFKFKRLNFSVEVTGADYKGARVQ